ncbi:hypothetical protein MQE23_08440 [Streptomyces sp. HP-A2021]|uniref:hypothetical protein n=1 Tax=Streptomyces sp. HP-A2021 TaxID=2927875 RepID=UPI001FAE87A4|nr:hypothetical protein [Streptomyces sp. HP-A2021]UOB09079.1 hypothetical protein MQE23_08440 [Streptomyces sp. HP-A2021]
MTPYTPTAGDRITIRRTAGPRVVFTKTGLVLGVHRDGGIHFQDDSGPRVHVATNAQLAPLGQSQTISPLAV